MERETQTLRFEIEPRDGQIGVASMIERYDLPLGLAAATAMASPFFSIFQWARELTEPRTLMAPVAIIMRDPSPWPLLFRLGELGSYAWPFSMLIVFVASRRRRQT